MDQDVINVFKIQLFLLSMKLLPYIVIDQKFVDFIDTRLFNVNGNVITLKKTKLKRICSKNCVEFPCHVFSFVYNNHEVFSEHCNKFSSKLVKDLQGVLNKANSALSETFIDTTFKLTLLIEMDDGIKIRYQMLNYQDKDYVKDNLKWYCKDFGVSIKNFEETKTYSKLKNLSDLVEVSNMYRLTVLEAKFVYKNEEQFHEFEKEFYSSHFKNYREALQFYTLFGTLYTFFNPKNGGVNGRLKKMMNKDLPYIKKHLEDYINDFINAYKTNMTTFKKTRTFISLTTINESNIDNLTKVYNMVVISPEFSVKEKSELSRLAHENVVDNDILNIDNQIWVQILNLH